MVHCKPSAIRKAKRAYRRAKDGQCFSDVGALDRIEKHFKLWEEPLKLQGSEESWLRLLQNCNFQCKCCFFRSEKLPHRQFKSLASAEGLPPTPWARLQTFRQHKTKQHSLNAALYVRATMPDAPAADVASPSHDFLDLLQAVRARKVKEETRYGKRKKLRAMMYCIAEACRRMKQKDLSKARQAALMHDGADDKLYCRLSLCTPEQTRVVGFLGVDNTVEKYKTADSLALANSLINITEAAFTEWEGVPFKTEEWRKAHQRFDTEAYDHFRMAVSQLNADEAGDEGRARELVTDKIDERLVKEFDELKLRKVNQMFPNGVIHSVDKPHSGNGLCPDCLMA